VAGVAVVIAAVGEVIDAILDLLAMTPPPTTIITIITQQVAETTPALVVVGIGDREVVDHFPARLQHLVGQDSQQIVRMATTTAVEVMAMAPVTSVAEAEVDHRVLTLLQDLIPVMVPVFVEMISDLSSHSTATVKFDLLVAAAMSRPNLMVAAITTTVWQHRNHIWFHNLTVNPHGSYQIFLLTLHSNTEILMQL